MKIDFANSWKKSKQQRKQRKYRHNAPLHVKSSFLNCHITPELRKSFGKRSVRGRKGDKVKILRGRFKGKTGKIERVDTINSKIFITNVQIVKKDGTKVYYPLDPSNIMITELVLDDKKRLKLFRKKEAK